MIKHHEGVKASAYRCPARLWTIGVGHVIDPNHARVPFADRLSLELPAGWNRTLSQDEINDILRKDLLRFEAGVHRMCPGELTQGQFDALVSFSFNVGLGSLQKSTLRMKHNRGDYEGAAEEFLKWSKAGGKVLKGLLKRREDERALYLS
jgi:GH24 family phage-related lysozyme (muramidase)